MESSEGRSPSGISAVSTAGEDRYEYPLLCLECGGQTGSELVIGICVIRGVSGWRLLKVARGLCLLLVADAPSVGAITGASSGAGAGVAGHVMGLYEPSGVIRRRSGALLEDDGDTGRVLPLEVGWLPYMGGASGSLRSHPRNSSGDMVSRCGTQLYLGWNGNPSDSPGDRVTGDGVFGT
jgi:hypothetical protein